MIQLATRLVNLGKYSAILLTKDVLERGDFRNNEKIIVNIESLNAKQNKSLNRIKKVREIKEVFV